MAENSIFAKRPLADVVAQAHAEEEPGRPKPKPGLTWIDLTALGIGAIIGTGIFVLTGKAAHDTTGPALMLSIVVAGLACVFAALCYAEFASMVPIAGSAYTYAYVTLGELFAWIIGWDLVLEYAVGAATVAHGWSHYFQDFLKIFGISTPEAFRTAPFDYDPAKGEFFLTGAYFDLPAVVIAVLMTVLLIWGIKESARFNNVMVAVKLSVVLFVIVVGAFYIDSSNWTPFAPYGYTGVSFFGHTIMGEAGKGGEPLGMMAGAAVIFFAYIGFDAVSTQAEEAFNPRRDLPIGILASLVICTLLYIVVAAVLTGMVRYDQLNIDAPVSDAFAQKGLPWAQSLVSVGAITGITSVLLVMMLSQPRILFAMARDGLLPAFFADIHPRFRTPWKSTIVTGLFVGTLGAFLPLRVLAELVNIGTLLAFVLVCGAVLVMRRINPGAHRPFRTPFVPLVPILGIALCLLLMFSLPPENWYRLGIWLLIGFAIYFGYGQFHSKLRLAGQSAFVRRAVTTPVWR
jgi:APA family basic amino acid/polyamine antiporter